MENPSRAACSLDGQLSNRSRLNWLSWDGHVAELTKPLRQQVFRSTCLQATLPHGILNRGSEVSRSAPQESHMNCLARFLSVLSPVASRLPGGRQAVAAGQVGHAAQVRPAGARAGPGSERGAAADGLSPGDCHPSGPAARRQGRAAAPRPLSHQRRRHGPEAAHQDARHRRAGAADLARRQHVHLQLRRLPGRRQDPQDAATLRRLRLDTRQHPDRRVQQEQHHLSRHPNRQENQDRARCRGP